MSSSAGATDEKSNSLWSQLPSFDPSTDDVREFTQKAKFLHGVFPEKDKSSLAPRLAMLCKGTAWSQVRHLEPKKLTDPTNGVDYLLQALSTWEETSELKTFELFEKAMYKVVQKPDEATHSYTLRLQAAFHDLGTKVTIQEMQAFILLRQSCLSNDDKKKILSMTGGELSLKKIESAMRTLSTKVLFGAGEVRKKIYPVNHVETSETASSHDDENVPFSTYHAAVEEDDALSAEALDSLVQAGDEDAMVVQQFESEFEEMLQSIPDLQSAMVTYHEARQRINDRRRSRGFWPPAKGRGKSNFRGGRKGGSKSNREELLAGISRTHCKICGAKGHWKAECPRRPDSAREQANVVHVEEISPHDRPHVIIEEHFEAGFPKNEVCFHVHNIPSWFASPGIRAEASRSASQFWSDREVLEAMRVLSEEILESLRILLFMLFSMTKAVQPTELVAENEMSPLNQLVAEIRSQKAKIVELGEIISTRFLQSQSQASGPPPMSPIQVPETPTDLQSWEEAELEFCIGKSALE
eukprot:s1651_g2.t1